MKGFLLFVLKFAIFNFWFSSTIVGINLLNQKVDWQNYLGVFILCLSLSCVVYYVKNNFHTLLNGVKDNLSKMVLYLKKMFKK